MLVTLAILREEAEFFKMLGHIDYVKNPAAELPYTWTKDEAIAAIRNGLAHAIFNGVDLFDNGPYISVVRFQDEDLGRCVAAESIAGFAA